LCDGLGDVDVENDRFLVLSNEILDLCITVDVGVVIIANSIESIVVFEDIFSIVFIN
jgi:hypothetical protein